MVLQCKKTDMFGNVSEFWKIDSVVSNVRLKTINVSLGGYPKITDIKTSPITKMVFQLSIENYKEIANAEKFDEEKMLERIYKEVSTLSFFTGCTLLEEDKQEQQTK